MPKPVLSDSLFNATDVATAILNNAELSVSNQSLGVEEVTDLVTASGSVNIGNTAFYTFNGFAFVSFTFDVASVSSGLVVATIKTNYEPVKRFVFPSISYQGDSVNYISAETNGDIKVSLPNNQGDSHFYGIVNGFYRFT